MTESTKYGCVSNSIEAPTAPIQILFGTTTGNSEILAEETAEKLSDQGYSYELCSTEDFSHEKLYQIEQLLLIVSTDSGGVPPFMAEDFYQYLNDKTEPDLDHLKYSVLALGDSYYPQFCQAGKDFDNMLEELGAHRIAERVDCDIRFWDDYDDWINKVISAISKEQQILEHKV